MTAEETALREALRALVECMDNRSVVEGDLPWTTDVVAALKRANALLVGQPGECGAIGERWVCIKPAGHGGLHAYEKRSTTAPAAGQKGEAE